MPVNNPVYTLYIGNKNYSTWSLRPWVLMQEMGIAFTERLVPFAVGSNWQSFRQFSPTGKVPCLVDGDTTVWDSLAIAEYLAEKHPGLWPTVHSARAFARCAAAEMHAGFTALRTHYPMNCGIRVRPHPMPEAVRTDLARIDELWNDGLARFKGPFLAGERFGIVDAFFAPVAFRIQTYQPALSQRAHAYAQQLLGLQSMQSWERAALQEPWREAAHESEAQQAGEVLEDRRVSW